MKEHPIPQDITGYNFHIIGNMTIKQFAEIGLGVGLAIVIYFTNLPVILKWMLIGLSAATGAGAAFVPFEERPLDHWLIVFVRALYKPTKYFWKRQAKIPDVFTYQAQAKNKIQVSEIDLTPQRRARIKEYLASVRANAEEDVFFLNSHQQEGKLLAMFSDKSSGTTGPAVKTTRKPELKVKVRSLRKSQIPAATSVKVEKKEQVIWQQEKAAEATSNQVFSDTQAASEKSRSATEAKINKNLPFVDKAKEANKLVGMTLTPNDELIDGVLLEINDQNGKSVAALTSNALGQFFLSQALPNGEYFIKAKKSGFNFPEVKINLTGQIIEPLDIRSA